MKKILLMALIASTSLMATIEIERTAPNQAFFEQTQNQVLVKLSSLKSNLNQHIKCVENAVDMAGMNSCKKEIRIMRKSNKELRRMNQERK